MKVTFGMDRGRLDSLLVNYGPRLMPALAAAMQREGERVLEASNENVPVDYGVLRGSGFVDVVVNGVVVEATVGYGGASWPYSVYLHEGTGPAAGRPQFYPGPGTELWEDWAPRHGFDTPSKRAALARSIGTFGLEPRKFLERALNAARDGMDDRLAADVREQLGAFAGFQSRGSGGGRKISVAEFTPIARRPSSRPPSPPTSGRRAPIGMFKRVKKKK